MCGRVVLSSAPHILAEAFFLDQVPDLLPRFNIAPGQDLACVVPNPLSEGRIVRMLNWGLVPAWSRDPGSGPRPINARSETVRTKPTFRDAFAKRRCLIPVDGFYEWQKRDDGKQPFLFRAPDQRPLALAGLWEEATDAEGSPLATCTILTTRANGVMRPVHHRMPVILPEADWKLWLGLSPDQAEDLEALLRPAPADTLVAVPVSREVNRPAFDEPRCLEPVPDERTGQMDLFG